MERRVSSLSHGQRLLAAIMVTDAVGFSARMSMDEGLTLRLIDQDLTVIADTCEAFGGTVLKSTGDGLLMYFLSAVEAVSCGLEMQRRLIEQTSGLDPTQYLDHRIGIHLGDILVSEQDVMGNGVNITARLQTYAKPRGLCVSQTIYDVVKARLVLHATFLGPLHLKNIQEPVPAYQLALDPEALETDQPLTGAEGGCTLPMTAEGLLSVAVRNLSTDHHSLRIKKLVFATYQQAWENDPKVLEQFDLRSLLVHLQQRYPSLEELEEQLEQVVMGLNRPDLYSDIAATVLRQVQPWYLRSPDVTDDAASCDDEPTQITIRTLEERCRTAARQISQSPESLRMRKLLYCLCHNAWENNPTVLHQIDLPTLVQETLNLVPTNQDVRYHLSRILKHLNRRSLYTQVANELLSYMQPLYASQTGAAQLSDGDSPAPEAALATLHRDSSGETMVTRIAPSPPVEFTTLHADLSNPAVAPTVVQPVAAMAPKQGRSTLFDLRLEIIQYTSPLRAKILLYSCLHGPFGYTRQDWSQLKRCTLDSLLRQVFDYCPSYADLDSKLTIIARCLGQDAPMEQVAGSIVQAMRAYYPADPEAAFVPAAVSHGTTHGAAGVVHSTPVSLA
ncbi:adenylate/guanylate cyclase domain-containing protein [Nodosilinea sp. P-1105]|uniref:adenylate/guanylate cyclase domain-containing protein n=1 Tax=Nodosilinea sp. P-1105 TaxID=2546229 RepID=UPI00197D2C23|nr:adenylate/guanylate cyclase domain-containing protein [Nodosilinea sp. P-1105]